MQVSSRPVGLRRGGHQPQGPGQSQVVVAHDRGGAFVGGGQFQHQLEGAAGILAPVEEIPAEDDPALLEIPAPLQLADQGSQGGLLAVQVPDDRERPVDARGERG